MHIGLEIAAFLVLVISVMSGLQTLAKHTNRFDEFRSVDLLPQWLRRSARDIAERNRRKQLRIQGIMYVVLTGSTTFSIFDILARGVWLFERGWLDAPLKWKVIFLFVHIGIGTLSTAMHVIFDCLLSDDEFCALCRRRIERGGTNN